VGGTLVALGIWMLVSGAFEGAWFVFLGGFLALLADRTYRAQALRLRAAAIEVGEVQTALAPTVDADAPLSAARQLASAHPAPVAVVSGGVVRGFLQDGAEPAGAVEPAVASAGSAAGPPPAGILVDARESLETALRRFAHGTFPALLIVRDGRLGGFLTREDLRTRLG
jgi:CBS domain-containing protein